jgi:hypothetical protein
LAIALVTAVLGERLPDPSGLPFVKSSGYRVPDLDAALLPIPGNLEVIA